MKHYKKNLILFFIFCIIPSLCAQSQTLNETYLPTPNQCSLKYFKTLEDRHIFYGKKPSRPNGKVILFVPGYLEEADFLLLGNSFYKKAYQEGYQTAFLSMTRGEGDWVNGEILSRAIDQVKATYKVGQIDIVAHSNGGKASEVALFHYGKDPSINKIITLGTPFWGTQIADATDFALFQWVLSIIGFETGRAYSTTYYCETQWRPYFERLTTPQQRQKYYTYGAWGYLHGKSALFALPMATTGAIIKLNGGGANDGVTPFYSSSLPGGNQIYRNSAIQGRMNHMDMVYGEYVWANIRNILNSRTTSYSLKIAENEVELQKKITASSNFQIVADNELNKLQQEVNASEIRIRLIREDADANFDIINNATKEKVRLMGEPDDSLKSASEKQNIISSKIILPKKVSLARRVSEQDDSQYRIEGNSRFVAFVEQDVESPMQYKVINRIDRTILEVTFPNILQKELSLMKVSAQISYSGSLDGKLAESRDIETIEFKLKNNKFIYETRTEKEGVYSMLLTGSKEGVYKRDLVSGFTVGNLKNIVTNTENSIASKATDDILLYPTPAKDILNIDIKKNSEYTIIDLAGRTVRSGKLNTGTNHIHINGLPGGIYIFKVKDKQLNRSIKFVVE